LNKAGGLSLGETALKEAVEDRDDETAVADKPTRRLRLPWKNRDRSDASETTPGTEVPDESETPVDASPLAYKTFSHKLPPALTALGGIIAIAGGLGAWVRATRLQTEGLQPEQVSVSMGYNDPEGLTIAVLGGVAALTALLWLRRKSVFGFLPAFALKLIPLLASLAVIGLSAWQLPLIDQQASALAQEAVQDATFTAFHAGLGWGAWLLIVACVLLFLGNVIGVLREVDLRSAAKRRSQEGDE
jgi:hypothetical protein